MVQEDRALVAEQQVEEARNALHQAQADWDKAQAAFQKVLSESAQNLADQGMQQLR